MDGDVYVDILEKTLIPFVNKVYPNGHIGLSKIMILSTSVRGPQIS